jgi:hypothetical protein
MTMQDVMNAPTFDYVQPFYEQAVNAFKLRPSPFYGQLETAFGNKIDEYLKGDITVDECIDETIALWMDILPEEAEATTEDPPPPPPPPIPGYGVPFLAVSLFVGVIAILAFYKKKMRN